MERVIEQIFIAADGISGFIIDGDAVCAIKFGGYCEVAKVQGIWAISCEVDEHPSVDEFESVMVERGIFECDGCGDSFVYVNF